MKKINFSTTPKFAKDFKKLAKKYKSINSDLSNLLDQIRENPRIGSPLGGSMYKIRLSIKSKNRGKSGGARVIDYVCEINSEQIDIYLLDIYDKSEIPAIDTDIYKEFVKSFD